MEDFQAAAVTASLNGNGIRRSLEENSSFDSPVTSSAPLT
jgi:hypothetical protein